MTPPFVSIIIPTYKRTKLLQECLGALMPQMPENFELIVSDDSPGDETKKMVETHFPTVRWMEGNHIASGPNRNMAVRSARGEWLIFLDDDCLPLPSLIAAYLAEIKKCGSDAKVLLAGPALRTDGNKNSILWEAPRSAMVGEIPPSCNFAIPRQLYVQTGGFDERFHTAFEDIEYFTRLQFSGVDIRFLPEAAVAHDSRPIPSAYNLAWRWEARVISSYDFGASTVQILLRLPRHILLVIFSRFRGHSVSLDTIRAASIFGLEFFYVLCLIPRWLLKYGRLPRSPFWIAQTADGNAPPKFGL